MMSAETDLAAPIVKHYESCHLERYLCPAGVPTIGWGETAPERVTLGRITQGQADAWLAEDLHRISVGVKLLVKVELTVNELAALISFAYNAGLTALEESTLLRLLNEGKKEEAAEQFRRWVHGGGRVLPGLVARRAAEQFVFKGGTIKDLAWTHRWFQ